MLAFVREIMDAQVSLNVVVTLTSEMGDRLASPFIANLAMFAPLGMFRKAAAPLIRQATLIVQHGFNDSNGSENESLTIFQLGTALNFAIIGNNKEVMEFLFSLLNRISSQASVDSCPLTRAAYQAPIQFLYSFFTNGSPDRMEWTENPDLELSDNSEQINVLDKLYKDVGFPCEYSLLTPLAVACCTANWQALRRITAEPLFYDHHNVLPY